MVIAAAAVLLVLSARPAPAQPVDADHHAPAESLAAESHAVSSERQKTLSEMWQRRIIAVDATHWTPEDMALLLKTRAAEASGALTYLHGKLRTAADLSVDYKTADGKTSRRLTKEGLDKYLFLKTQDAISYFQSKDIDAKWVFQLMDLTGKPLFDANGLLTAQGDVLYSSAAADLPAFWRMPDGTVGGTRRPPAATSR
jgi:hypothetical protein